MRIILLVSVIILAILVFTQASKSHDWYDEDCCGGEDDGGDCSEYNGPIVVRAHEYYFPALKQYFPRKYARPSRDAKYHICVSSDGFEFPGMLICVYVPLGS